VAEHEERIAMNGPTWNTLGLVINLVGVFLLFRYGMPYRVETGGAIHRVVSQVDEKAKAAESIYRWLGWIGVLLILVGTVLQIVGAWAT